MMSKCLKDKNQPKFFYAPLIPLTLQILYKERKKKLESFEETPPSSQLNASCEKMENKQKQKEKAIFFAVLNNFVFFFSSLP